MIVLDPEDRFLPRFLLTLNVVGYSALMAALYLWGPT